MITSYKGYFSDWRVTITDTYMKLARHNLMPTMLFLHYKKGSYPTYTSQIEGTLQGQFQTEEYILKIIHEESEEGSNGEIILTDKDDTITLIHLYHIPEILIAGLHLLGLNKLPVFGIPYYDRDSDDSGYTSDTEIAVFSSDDE